MNEPISKTLKPLNFLLGWSIWLPPSIASICLVAIASQNFLLFHTLAESASIFIAILMAVVAWQTYPFSRNNFLMFLATGYFWIGALDGVHTLVYKGMNILPVSSVNQSAQFWIATRYCEALLLLLAPIFLMRQVNRKLAFAGFGMIAVTLYLLIMSDHFPEAFIEGSGLTAFKINSEYLIDFLLLCALVHTVMRREHLAPDTLVMLAASIVLTMIAELAFTYYISVYGLSNLVGHLFKIFSFWLIFVAVIRSNLVQPYTDLQAENLWRRSAESKLQDAHDNLESEIDERTAELQSEISQRKRTAEDLRASETRIRAIIDNTAEGIVTINDRGLIETFNPAAEDMFGYSAPEVMGQNIAMLMEEGERAQHDSYLEKSELVASRVLNQSRDLYAQRKNGEIFPIEINLSNMELKGARHFIGIMRDISERKRSADRIKESEAKFRQIFQMSPELFAISRLDDGTYVDINDQFTVQTGYTRDDTIGKSSTEMGFWHTTTSREKIVAGLKETGQVNSLEMDICRKDGSIYTALISSSIVQLNDEPHILSTTKDVSEIRKSQQDAETANRAKSEFLSSMSHELRTPLNAVLGFAQLLQYNPQEPLSEVQASSVSHIMKGGEHLLELINEVLDLAKIEAGNTQLSIEDIPMSEVIDDCLPLVRDMAAKRDIEIFIPDIKDQRRVHADLTRIKQVLLNFLTNAVKYNRKGGSITLHCTETSLNMLHVAVTDTGDGIPQDKHGELFTAFSRLGAENTDIEGTGIGLVVTKNLVELMSGKIGFESKEGVGSTFWFEIPLVDADADNSDVISIPEGPQQAVPLEQANGSILYVEDNPENLKVMEMVISFIDGLSLFTAESAEFGIDLAKSKQPDVIIMDINLPGMDGIEALEILRNLKETRDIPVIALSALATKGDAKTGMQAGFFRYITKPMHVPNMIQAIKDALENNSSL